jgi:hypothetical protein
MDNTGNSILNSIKKLFGPDAEYTHFDPDLILHINSVFSTLTQLGVGPKQGFSITGVSETWDDFFNGIPDVNSLSMVKSYVYLKVRLLFDPPASSAAIESINRQISEYEWRLFVAADPPQ